MTFVPFIGKRSFKCYVMQMRVGPGAYHNFLGKALRRCKVQCIRVGGGPISRKKPLRNT